MTLDNTRRYRDPSQDFLNICQRLSVLLHGVTEKMHKYLTRNLEKVKALSSRCGTIPDSCALVRLQQVTCGEEWIEIRTRDNRMEPTCIDIGPPAFHPPTKSVHPGSFHNVRSSS